ncbi:MAG TPA: hypothetical protein VFC21_11225 [Bryobacteraceae bacterium]|nr:hypothetical protein [Bryobacteraceae bacterium]
MDDLRNLWQNQEVEEMNISVEALRAKAARFQARIRRRNLREQAACAFVIVGFGWMCFTTPAAVPRIAFGLIILAAIYVAYCLRARGSAKPLPSDLGRDNCLAFHRRELARQRDLLRGIWKWYLGPLLPGIVLLVIYGIAVAPEKWWRPMPFAVVAVFAFWLIARLNKQGAQQLDRQIEEVDRELRGA